MKNLNLLLILLTLFVVSCGSSDDEVTIETADGEFIEVEDTEFGFEDENLEKLDSELLADEEFSSEIEGMASDSASDASSEVLVAEDQLVADDQINIQTTSSSSTSLSQDLQSYTVQKGDTLMLISFKLYGNYTRWRSLASLNPGTNYRSLVAGSSIKYYAPEKEFIFNPRGNPHLIIRGETLGTISNDKYGTSAHWKSIYNNNRSMIKDPNLIFAGFTLYWLPKSEIVASN